MTIWLMWACGVTGLAGAAGWVAERALRNAGRPGRWAWIGAIGSALGLQAWSWLASAAPTVSLENLAAITDVVGSPGSPAAALGTLSVVGDWLSGFDAAARAMWLGGSALLALVLGGGLLRLRLRMRHWTPASVAGERVLLSRGFGPALVGVVKPWIVIPRWTLGLDAERLRMTFLHEAEHRRARDTTVLLAASLALVVNPWNPAMWWCVGRLRQSVELDCDRRVLARGIPAESYGTLLIDLSAAAQPCRLPVAALSNQPSLLERRLMMMKTKTTRLSPLRVTGTIAIVAALSIAACGMPTPALPTASEAPDVRALETGGGASSAALDPIVYVDGIRLRGELAFLLDEIDMDRIERVEVIKGEAARRQYGDEGANGVILVTMKDEGEVAFGPAADGGETLGGVLRRRQPAESGAEPQEREMRFPARGASDADPILYIDGELAESIDEIGDRQVARAEVVGEGADRTIYVTTKPREGGR